MKYDFGGYVTKNDLRCADGRIIRKGAFQDCNGMKVPLIWQHLRDDPENVLGHAILEERDDGVYGYCKFNNSEKAQLAKEAVMHGDVDSLSIYANHLRQNGSNVQHGVIREVSLVIAGANPGAHITDLNISHSDEDYATEALIYSGEPLDLEHAEDGPKDKNSESGKDSSGNGKDKTLQEVFDTLNEEQKTLFYAMVGQALNGSEDDEENEEDEETEHSDEGGKDDMGYNVFDQNGKVKEQTLTHDEMSAIVDYAKKCGSMKQAVEEAAMEHGITDLEILFPEAKPTGGNTPSFIGEPEAWVGRVWNGVRKSPFSRVKSVFADITMDEARAKGYIKGKRKQEEQFSLLKRVTTPQTIYKKQRLDRDDIIDITDFDVVTWMKAEMRMKLNEELSRAILIGDGRAAGAEDKINESNIRSILNDDNMYTIKHEIAPDASFIDEAVLARVQYKGSGSPVLFVDPMTIAKALISKDQNGRRIYNTMGDLASAMMVREIIEVPLMEGLTRTDSSDQKHPVYGIIVNLNDYNIGADRGGAVSMFDDFDIDYNRYTYLIETRCSGALIKPYSAIVLEGPATVGA